MKKLLLSFYFLFFIISSNVAQEKGGHKIIFQCSTPDTMAQKALMKQLGNILSVEPNTKIEIVCHGPGLNMLVDDKSVVKDKIKSFSDKGVIFNACEFSMKERNVDKSQITSNVSFVSAGILYIVSKQEQGWSYIKAGF
jgi:intracellular sulfur oxidation DsrE/DsrF family protein